MTIKEIQEIHDLLEDYHEKALIGLKNYLYSPQYCNRIYRLLHVLKKELKNNKPG